MQRLNYLIASLVLSILFYSCQSELGELNPPIVPGVANPITATVQGNIIDEAGQPAGGVQIRVGNKTAITDTKGYFRITKASLDKNTSLVTAEKSGYFKAYRSFRATNGANHINIKLVKRMLTGTIQSGTGGDATLGNGAKVVLPADAVVKAAGGTYSGDIRVYAAYIDPSATDIRQTVPGSLMADDKNGNRVTLESYSMLAVELESSSGEKLQIAPGKKATLTMPVPSSFQASAPATISLWYVDEQSGVWKEQGTATRNGANYIGDVTHFSFWNCDIGLPAVHFSATLKTPEGTPLRHVQVRIKRTTANQGAYGFTDSLGQVSGLVPANETLVLDVVDDCGSAVYTQNIGPYSPNSSPVINPLTVTMPASNQLAIKGKLVDCAGLPVAGTALIQYRNSTWYINAGATGEFMLSLINCMPAATCTIIGENTGAQQQGSPVTVAIATPVTDAGNIIACGVSTNQFINYTVDGTNYSFSSTVAGDSLLAYTTNAQVGPYALNTTIRGHVAVGGTKDIMLMFGHDAATGNYTLVGNEMKVNTYGPIQAVVPFPVVLTRYAIVGEFYEGSFNGQFKEMPAGTLHTLSGTFRLKRRQ